MKIKTQEALQKLTALEAETKALRAIIEAPDTPTVPKRWRPQSGESYIQVGMNGVARIFTITPTDKEYAYGNYFQTKAQAEIAAKAVGVTLKMCAAAFAVDPDAGEFTAARRYSVYRHDNGLLVACRFSCDRGNSIYVHTITQAEQMSAILNAEGV